MSVIWHNRRRGFSWPWKKFLIYELETRSARNSINGWTLTGKTSNIVSFKRYARAGTVFLRMWTVRFAVTRILW